MDALDDFLPLQFPLGSLMIHERALEPEEYREVINRPIGFIHFKDHDDA